MRAVKKSTALRVLPQSSWRQNMLLSLAAFGLTAAAVYFISQNFFQKFSLENGSKAIAVVEQKPVMDRDNFPKSQVWGPSLNLNNIKTRILSPAFMQQALRDCGIDISQGDENRGRGPSDISLAQLYQGLSIQSKPGKVAGENQIILELALNQSPDALKIAQALTDRFVHEYRTYWATEMREAYLAVLAQADQAEQAHHEAVEELQEFKNSISKQEPSPPEQQPSQTQTDEQATPQNADNPAWIELNSKLAMLRRQEAAMLVNKTPLHPDILIIRGRIADFEHQLASTPRFTAELSTERSSPQIVSPSGDKTSLLVDENKNQNIDNRADIRTEVDRYKTADTLEQLQVAVKRCKQEYLEKSRRKQQLFEASHKDPIFSVSVNPNSIAKTEGKTNQGLIKLMLFSGFAMAVGISVFSSGVTTQPVLATIADLEPLLPAPIIGLVPSKDPSFDPVARRRRQVIRRWTSILLGVLIVLECIAGVCWFFTHLA